MNLSTRACFAFLLCGIPIISSVGQSLNEYAVAPALAGCGTSLSVESRTEYYFSESDLLSQAVLNPILLPVPLRLAIGTGAFEILQGGTNCAALSAAGVTLTGQTPLGDAFSFEMKAFLPWVGDAVRHFAEEGIFNNGTLLLLAPSIEPCEPRLVRSFVHFGGNVDVLVEHAGGGPYPRKITKGTFNFCRDLVVLNNSGTPVEIPVSVSGEIIVYGSFSVDSRNYAKARLSLSGAIGGQAVALQGELHETQLDPFGYTRTLNETRRVTIPSSPQPQTLHIDLQGEAVCEAQAKGGGLSGFITASSAATANFPNSIDIGLPTGPGGGPLPPGVRIYDAEDGSVYMDTTANPVSSVPVPPRTNNPPFAITRHHRDTNGLLHLVYPANTNDYYLLYAGPTLTTVTNPIAMRLGTDTPNEFVAADVRRLTYPSTPLPELFLDGASLRRLLREGGLPSSFYRLREVPLARPLDVDGDGFDDLTEYRNPALNPFVPVIVATNPPPTVSTNAPPTGDTNSTSGQIFLWAANKHRYLPVVVTNGITWPEADAAARAVGGHLATLTSAAENAFVFSLIDRPEYWKQYRNGNYSENDGPWLGGWQADEAAEPAAGWQWVTPEPFDFTAWAGEQPNNASSVAGANENRMHYFSSADTTRSQQWNDAVGDFKALGYVVEFEPATIGGDCVPRDGLVAWWKADGNALDSVGDNDGLLVNGIDFGEGVSDRAFQFDGTPKYVKVPYLSNSPAFNLTTQLTYSLWVKPTSPPRWTPLIGRTHCFLAWPSAELFLQTNGGNFSVELYLGYENDGTFTKFTSPSVVTPDAWHHIGATYNQSTSSLDIYVDGVNVLHTNYSRTLWTPALPYWLGGTSTEDNAHCAQFARSSIDDVLIYNRALTAAEIVGIYTGGMTGRCQPQCVPPPPGLVALWKADGNALDRTGNNVGTLINGATFASGLAGQAFSLDGVDDYVEFGSSIGNFGTSDFSIAFWMRNEGLELGAFLGKRSGCSYTSFVDLRGGGETLTFEYCQGSADNAYVALTSTPVITTGVWHHATVVRKQRLAQIYVDGVLNAMTSAQAVANISNSAPFAVGMSPCIYRPDGGTTFYKGLLDEVGVYNRALTADEIASIYLAGSAGLCTKPDCTELPAGLLAWWPAEGNANDVVGNHHGTNQNGTTFAPGIAGQAFSLDGVNDYADMGEGFNLDDMTLAAWAFIDPEKNTGSKRIISKDNFPAGTGRRFFALISSGPYSSGRNGHPWFTVGSNPNNPSSPEIDIAESPVPLTSGWHHLAGVRQTSTGRLELYVDGALVSRDENVTVLGPIDSPARTVIGQLGPTSPEQFFSGLIDEPMIFNRALSAAEIQALYQSAAAPPAGPVVDHGGADWTVSSSEVISGAHINIGAFVIPAGVTARVAPFNGASGGSAEIRAGTIRVAGTLDATGKGYPGGGGAGGGGGGDQLEQDGGNPGNRGLGGNGFLGSSAGSDGTPGRERRGGDGGAGGRGFAFTIGSPGFPGLGGNGANGGENATHNPVGTDGLPGGYSAPGTNGDFTVGDEVHPGFGGGGGGGGGGGHSRDVNSGGGGGGGGGSGGFGGGAIILRASQRLEVTGMLLAQGTLGTNGAAGGFGQPYNTPNDRSPGGNGGTGASSGLITTNNSGGLGGANACDTTGTQTGNCSGAGGRGGDGGAGAGGGILLRAPLVSVSGTINNTGGGGATANGGTVKIYSTCGGQNVKGTITSGRLVKEGILMRP